VQQFVTPAVGIGAALVIIRGFSKKGSPTVGNFWVDVTRALLYVLTPIAFIGGLIFVGWKQSSSWEPTVEDSSTSTRPIPSRTRRA
jgi:K+-transporting ATPase A subunit